MVEELHKRKSPEEFYGSMGKTEEKIQNLIKRDQSLSKLKLKLEPTRDISHLRDKLSKAMKKPPLQLPTNLIHLKSLMQTSNSKGIQIALSTSGISPLTCIHKECIERVATHNSSKKLMSKSSSRKLASLNTSPVVDKIPTLEREFLGSPSGMQEIESLYEWFNLMKCQCEDEESTEVVYTMCARELLRQVSVNSALRGKLLEEILEVQPSVFNKKYEKLSIEFKTFREEQEEKIRQLEEKIDDDKMKKFIDCEELRKEIKKKDIIIEKLEGTLANYKKALTEIKRKFFENEEVWKNRLIVYMNEVKHLKRSSTVNTNQILDADLMRLKNKLALYDDNNLKLVIESLSHISDSSDESFKDSEKKQEDEVQAIEDGQYNQETSKSPSKITSKSASKTVSKNSSKCSSKNALENELEYINPEKNDHDEILILEKAEENSENREEVKNNLKDKEEVLEEKSAEIIDDNQLILTSKKSIELDGPIKVEHSSDKIKEPYLDNIEIAVFDEDLEIETGQHSPSYKFIKLSEDGPFNSEKICEAPSILEESREQAKNTSVDSDIPKIATLQLCQETQTDDLLFEKYLEKLKSVEELIEKAKPEDVERIYQALKTSLDNDLSLTQQSIIKQNRKISFRKTQKELKRSFSVKANQISEPNIKPHSAIPDSSPRSAEKTNDEVKEQVSALINSVNYMNTTITHKKQELTNLDREITEKSKILKILTKKKVKKVVKEEKSPENDRRPSSIKATKFFGDDRRPSDKFLNEERRTSEPQNAEKLSAPSPKGQSKVLEFTLNETELSPWDEGYEVGYGDGKIQGFIKAIEKIKGTEETNEIDSEDYEANDFRPIRKKSERIRLVTKFMEFNFHIPTKNKPKKIHPGPIILEKFLSRSLAKIKMRSTLSRKNLNKILIVIYQNAIQKVTLDNSTTLIEVTYDEFYSRYGLKSVCDKKFLEFVASAISNIEYKRCMMYIRLMRCGEVVSSYSYSKYSLLLYLSCFQFTTTSKLGISFQSDEDDKIVIPSIRMVECIKEKLDFLADKSIASGILAKVEQKSFPDPKKINAGGLVEFESSLEIVLDSYEKYISNIWKGISLCLRSMGQHNKHTVLGMDFNIILRTFSKLTKDGLKEVSVEEMYIHCIKFNICNEQDVIKITPNLTKDELFETVTRYKERIINAIEELKNQDSKILTYDSTLWRLRLEVIEENMENDLFLANLAWKFYEVELKRIFGEELVKIKESS